MEAISILMEPSYPDHPQFNMEDNREDRIEVQINPIKETRDMISRDGRVGHQEMLGTKHMISRDSVKEMEGANRMTSRDLVREVEGTNNMTSRDFVREMEGTNHTTSRDLVREMERIILPNKVIHHNRTLLGMAL